MPAPVLVIPTVLVLFELPIAAVTVRVGARLFTSRPFTKIAPMLKTRLVPLSSSSEVVPEITPGAATFEEVAVTPPLRNRVPLLAVARFTVGELPPMELRVRPARVLTPNRVRVEPPLSTGLLAALIWPWVTDMVAVALLRVRPPAGTTACAQALLRVSVPLGTLITVPPL